MEGDRYLLRVRGLKTNFYTYQGVVKALDGIDMEVRQGETVGIVGETGCGKSVTALSVLRLIPSPPGKVEAGEALVDIREDEVEALEALRNELRGVAGELFNDKKDYSKAAVSLTTLSSMAKALERNKTMDRAQVADLQKKVKALREKLRAHDLLSMDDKALREIRGNTISMIFQEPMQALNPVFTIGNQISESIVLHRHRWLCRRIVMRMRAETLRDRVVQELRPEFPKGQGLPQGVDLAEPSISDLLMLRESLSKRAGDHATLMQDLSELLAYERLLGFEVARHGIFSHALPRSLQIRLYETESLSPAWRAADVVQELGDLAAVLPDISGKSAPWSDARITGPFAVSLTPAPGTAADELVKWLVRLFKGADRPAAFWSILGKVLNPPKAEGGVVLLSVRKELQRARISVVSRGLGRVPLLKRAVNHPMNTQAFDESAEVLGLLKIPDPRRVIHMYPHELSGGMNQRAMIAIALACDPLLLIADEPTTALDVTIQAQILELLKDLKSRGRPSLILITHDLGVIAEMCDRVEVMYGGHVIESATTRAIFRNPLHPYTRGLLKAIPSQTVRRERLEVIKGSVPNLIYPPAGCRFHPRCPVALVNCGWDSKDLEAAVNDYQAELEIPKEAITEITQVDTFVLKVSFSTDGAGKEAMAALQKAIARDRPNEVMLQAIQQTKQQGSDLVFTLLKSRKPRDLEVEPGHMVACVLYEQPNVAAPPVLEVA